VGLAPDRVRASRGHGWAGGSLILWREEEGLVWRGHKLGSICERFASCCGERDGEGEEGEGGETLRPGEEGHGGGDAGECGVAVGVYCEVKRGREGRREVRDGDGAGGGDGVRGRNGDGGLHGGE
jgi:hypothetical protein